MGDDRALLTSLNELNTALLCEQEQRETENKATTVNKPRKTTEEVVPVSHNHVGEPQEVGDSEPAVTEDDVQRRIHPHFFHNNETVRAAAMCCLRRTIATPEDAARFLALPLSEVALVRNLEQNQSPKEASQQSMRLPPPPATLQALLLVKRLLMVAPGLLPHSVVASLVALSQGDEETTLHGATTPMRHASSGFTKELRRTSSMRMEWSAQRSS